MSDLGDIFDRQAEFQRQLGHDLAWMPPDKLIDYVRLNVLAATDELHEALNECQWKPWRTGDATLIHQTRFGGELVDAMHFLVNLFLVIGWDADRVVTSFMAKNDVNLARQADGYDDASAKCAYTRCRRALDEPYRQLLDQDPAVHLDGLAWCNDGCYDAWDRERAGEVLESGGAP